MGVYQSQSLSIKSFQNFGNGQAGSVSLRRGSSYVVGVVSDSTSIYTPGFPVGRNNRKHHGCRRFSQIHSASFYVERPASFFTQRFQRLESGDDEFAQDIRAANHGIFESTAFQKLGCQDYGIKPRNAGITNHDRGGGDSEPGTNPPCAFPGENGIIFLIFSEILYVALCGSKNKYNILSRQVKLAGNLIESLSCRLVHKRFKPAKAFNLQAVPLPIAEKRCIYLLLKTLKIMGSQSTFA